LDALVEGFKRRFDVLALFLQILDLVARLLQRQLELRPVALMRVEIQNLADVLQREADTLALQNELEPCAIPRRIDTIEPVARRRKQTFVFVDPQSAWSHLELTRKLTDCVRLQILPPLVLLLRAQARAAFFLTLRTT